MKKVISVFALIAIVSLSSCSKKETTASDCVQSATKIATAGSKVLAALAKYQKDKTANCAAYKTALDEYIAAAGSCSVYAKTVESYKKSLGSLSCK